MSKAKRLKPKKIYPYHKNFTLTKRFQESAVYAQMIKIDIDVLTYLYGKLHFPKTSKKKFSVATNNGLIEVSIEIMAKNLKVGRDTASKSVGRLVGWGLLEITRYGGDNTCHMYKILINANPYNNESVCSKYEERWRKWSEQNNWDRYRPQRSKMDKTGTKTQFKKNETLAE